MLVARRGWRQHQIPTRLREQHYWVATRDHQPRGLTIENQAGRAVPSLGKVQVPLTTSEKASSCARTDPFRPVARVRRHEIFRCQGLSPSGSKFCLQLRQLAAISAPPSGLARYSASSSQPVAFTRPQHGPSHEQQAKGAMPATLCEHEFSQSKREENRADKKKAQPTV